MRKHLAGIVLHRWATGALLAALLPLAAHAQAPAISNTFAFTENRNATSVFAASHTFVVGSTGVTPAGLAGTSATATHTSGGPNYTLGYVPAPFFPNQYAARSAYTTQSGQWDIQVTNPNGTAVRRTHALNDVRVIPLLSGVTVSGSLLTPHVTWNAVDAAMFPSFCGGPPFAACSLGTDIFRYQVEVRQVTGTPGNPTPIVFASTDITNMTFSGGVWTPTPTVFDIPTGFLADGNDYLIGVRFSHTEIEGFNANGSGIAALENRSVFYVEHSTMAPIPEPETYAMMLAGLAMLGVAARRRAKRQANAA